MSCVGGGGEGGEDLGDVEGHFFVFFFFFVLPWVVVFEGPFWEEAGRNFVRFPEGDVASFFLLLLLLLLGLAGCLSLARSLATTILSLPRQMQSEKGYIVSSLATSVKVASKIKYS